MRLRLLLVLLLGLAGLPSLFAQEGPFRRTDTQVEIEEGRSAYESIIASSRVSKNEDYRRRVQRILDQLVSALPEKLYAFQAVVLADNDVNACCLPGGYMFVNEGLLVAMPEDSELAFTLGHELGHAIRRHWARSLRRQQSDFAIAAFVSVMTKRALDEEGLYLRSLAHTREHESEADAFGTELYLRAGFDPAKVADTMKVFIDLERGRGSQVPLYLRTHPFPDDRFQAVSSLTQKLLAGGLKPIDVNKPDISVEQIFGKIPTIAPTPCPWQLDQPGTEWTYSVNSGSGNSEYVIKCTGAATVGQTKIAHMEIKLANRPVGYQVVADGDRVWRRNRLEKSDSPWSVEAVFPDEGSLIEEGGQRFEYVGKESLDVPAGHFPDCLKVKITTADGRVLIAWYASGTGLVKRFNEKAGVTETLVAMKRP